ncbi:MAG: GNAT family N-acetyltransferase [Spirochaetales bacterium]|nr:GNAT family N-acetyltransferase [Spirochaetales bacterium]
MSLEIKTDCNNIDWNEVVNILKIVDMAYHNPETHQKAFEASHAVVFVYDNNKLVGFGRAISDGTYQGAIYDVAVLPETQGTGVGKLIINKIREALHDCNLILYATPGMEGFYQKLGFGLMTTGMAMFTTSKAMSKFTK